MGFFCSLTRRHSGLPTTWTLEPTGLVQQYLFVPVYTKHTEYFGVEETNEDVSLPFFSTALAPLRPVRHISSSSDGLFNASDDRVRSISTDFRSSCAQNLWTTAVGQARPVFNFAV